MSKPLKPTISDIQRRNYRPRGPNGQFLSKEEQERIRGGGDNGENSEKDNVNASDVPVPNPTAAPTDPTDPTNPTNPNPTPDPVVPVNASDTNPIMETPNETASELQSPAIPNKSQIPHDEYSDQAYETNTNLDHMHHTKERKPWLNDKRKEQLAHLGKAGLNMMANHVQQMKTNAQEVHLGGNKNINNEPHIIHLRNDLIHHGLIRGTYVKQLYKEFIGPSQSQGQDY